MKRALLAVALAIPAAAMTLGACKKEDSATTTSAGSASASAAAASASGVAQLTALQNAAGADSAGAVPTSDVDKIPLPAAQATAAAKAVTTANYKSELDNVEKELNSLK